MFGVLLGAGGVTGFGIDESDEAEPFPLFGLFVGREDDFLDGAELLEMRLHVFLGGVQSHAAHEDLTDLLLLRDLFRVDLFAFDWREEGEGEEVEGKTILLRRTNTSLIFLFSLPHVHIAS